jgi:hypothetical protein
MAIVEQTIDRMIVRRVADEEFQKIPADGVLT